MENSSEATMAGELNSGFETPFLRSLQLLLAVTAVLSVFLFLTFAIVGYVRRMLPRKFYLLLISRSVADLCVLVMILYRDLSPTNIKVAMVMLCVVSIPHQLVLLGTNLALTVFKNIAVKNPLFYRRWATVRKTATIVGIIWCSGAMSSLPAASVIESLNCTVQEVRCNGWTPFTSVYIFLVMPAVSVLLYVVNVVGSVVLLMSLQRRVNNKLVQHELRRALAPAPSRTSITTYSTVVVKWTIVNFAVFCFPAFFYRLYSLGIYAMVQVVTSPTNVVNALGGFQIFHGIRYFLSYVSVTASIVRIIFDSILPFLTSADLRASFALPLTRRAHWRFHSSSAGHSTKQSQASMSASGVAATETTAF